MSSFSDRQPPQASKTGKLRKVSLNLTEAANAGETVIPEPPREAARLSPTDAIMSPCSTMLALPAKKKPWVIDRRKAKRRDCQAEATQDEKSSRSDADGEEDEKHEEGTQGSREKPREELEGEDRREDEPARGDQTFGSTTAANGETREALSGGSGVDLRLHPRGVPCSLPIILGSSSRFRRAIMDELGWQFSTAKPDIDEKAIRDPDPRKMCSKIARAKTVALMERLEKSAVLITADQVCLFTGDGGEEVREKPESHEQAKAFLQSYSSQSVRTLSALCVTNLDTGRQAEGVHETEIFWGEIPPDTVDAVVSRGVVMNTSGGFDIKDPDLRLLVERIDGSIDSIFGLPVGLLCELIGRVVQPVGA